MLSSCVLEAAREVEKSCHPPLRVPWQTGGDEPAQVCFAAQNLCTIYLSTKFATRPLLRHRARVFLAAYAVAMATMLLRLQNSGVRSALAWTQSFTMAGLQLSRLPQIIANYQTGRAPNLSVVPWVLNCLGSMARFYTTLTQLDGNTQLLANFAASVIINATMALQIAAYPAPAPLQLRAPT